MIGERYVVTPAAYCHDASHEHRHDRLRRGDASQVLEGPDTWNSRRAFSVQAEAQGPIFVRRSVGVACPRVKDNVAYVRRAKGEPDTVPRWMGGRMPLSSELSGELRRKLEEAADGKLVGPRDESRFARFSEIQRDGA